MQKHLFLDFKNSNYKAFDFEDSLFSSFKEWIVKTTQLPLD